MIDKLFIYKANGLNPYINIATEKLLLESVPENSCILYLWQNENTVVIGRNQNAWAECRTNLLAEEGGKLARRLSGGGAVFHDIGNLNFTFLMNDADYDLDKQLSVIQNACQSVGIPVIRSGRNDLLTDGQKFSGNAFYHTQEKAYHHGTLLVNANMEKLSRYLTPSKAKLQAKGVSSVRSRVINLQDIVPPLTCRTLSDCMEEAFCSVYKLTAEDILLTKEDSLKIEEYAKTLSSWEWLYGPRLPFSVEYEQRFAWGSVSIQLQIQSGKIIDIKVYSDAMDWTLASAVELALMDCRFQIDSIVDSLSKANLDPTVFNDICQMLSEQT